jgi:hypothetical protein
VSTTLWPSLRRSVDGVVGNVLLERHAVWDSVWNASQEQQDNELYSLHLEPVLSAVNDPKSDMVGFLTSLLSWTRVLSHLVSNNVEGIVAVLQSSCLESYTFVLEGPQVRTDIEYSYKLRKRHVQPSNPHHCTRVCSRLSFWALVICTTLPTTLPKY